VSVGSAYGMTPLNGLGGGSRFVPNGICGVQARCEVAEDSNILRCYVVPIGTHLSTFRWHCDALKRPELLTKRHASRSINCVFTFGQHNPSNICTGEASCCSKCLSGCLFGVRHSAAGRRKSDRPKRVAAIYRLSCVPNS